MALEIKSYHGMANFGKKAKHACAYTYATYFIIIKKAKYKATTFCVIFNTFSCISVPLFWGKKS